MVFLVLRPMAIVRYVTWIMYALKGSWIMKQTLKCHCSFFILIYNSLLNLSYLASRHKHSLVTVRTHPSVGLNIKYLICEVVRGHIVASVSHSVILYFQMFFIRISVQAITLKNKLNRIIVSRWSVVKRLSTITFSTYNVSACCEIYMRATISHY